uniref:Uncharacterized protein n=1 Tax=Chaetoceros debilis TaxID=122233 RepID=A0A7S3PXM1_9STRA
MEHLRSVECSSQKDDAYPIIPNCVVEISPRTWPGINKMGGVARVLNCHYDVSDIDCKVLTHLDVEYIVVGGKEKEVPIEYCKAAPQYDAAFQNGTNSSSKTVSNGSSNNGIFLIKGRVSLRDRSSLLGRCKLCGSLRSDCGSCDWVEEERKRREVEMQKEETRMDQPRAKSKARKYEGGMKRQPLFRFEDDFGGDGDSNSDLSSSTSSDESYVIRTNTMDRRKRKGRHHPRTRSILSSSSSDRSESGLSSDESSDNDFLSMRLRQLKSSKFEVESSKRQESENPSSSLKVGRLYAKRMLRNRRKSDKRYKERMKFLDEQLQNGVGQPSFQVTNAASDTNGSSVLEHLPLSGEVEDMDIDHSIEGYSETSRKESCNFQLKADIEENFCGAEVSTNDGQKVDSNDMMQILRREENEEIQNDDLPRKERIGIVDGEGIGESEVDQSEDIQDEDDRDRRLIPRIRRPLYQVARPEDIEGFYQDDMGTFIQPEGEDAAEKLPLGLVDRSASVKFIDLPEFIFEITKEVLEVKVPRAQTMTGDLEKALDVLKSMPSEEYMESMFGLEMQCFRHCRELSVRLIQEGTDQCQCAIKRFSNRGELQHSNGILTRRRWRYLQDTLDIKYDELDKEVDSILRAAKGVFKECSDLVTPEIDESDGSLSLSNGDNDVIYYSSSDDDVHTSKRGTSESKPYDLVHDQNNPTRKWYRTGKVRRNRGKSTRRNYESSNGSNVKNKQKRNAIFVSTKSADSKKVEAKKKSRRRAFGYHKETILNKKEDPRSNHHEWASLTSHGSESEVEISSSQSKTRDGKKSCHQSKRKENGHRSKKRISCASDSAQISTLKKVNLDVHHLFSELEMTFEETAQSLEVISFSSIHEALDQLSLVYPDQVSRTVLQEIPLLLDSATINRCLAKDIFKSILDALRVTGRHSLQELIQGRSERLRPHIDLLCCILALMRRKLHRYLEVHDGFLYKVFSTKSKESIVSLIVSQIIDVLYSNLLPSHWGMAKMLDEETYCALIQLRNGLGFLVHPLETLCQVLVKAFPSQEWRRSTVGGVSGEKWYVSSIDPETLGNLWKEGDSQVSKTISRLMKFKKNRPREEIEAIWCLLAWFAKTPTVEKECDELRWKLIISLFTYQTGVLGKNEQNKMSSPSQLIQCSSEIGYLCSLLKSGALDPIPNNDDLLAKLFSKLIHFHADSESTRIVRGFQELRKMPSRGETKAVFKSWLESDISNLFPNGQIVTKTNSVRLLADLYTWSPSDMPERKLSLSSSSKVLKSGICLVECWLSQLPDKKIRWTRLGDRLTTLLAVFVNEVESGHSHLSEGREKSSATDIADAFGKSFAVKEDYEAPNISNEFLRTTSRCEAIVFVTICARHMRDNFKTEGDRKFPMKINKELCKKIWILLADERLKEHEIHVSKHLNVLQNYQKKKKSSIFAAYIITKLFSSLLFQIMAELETRHSKDPAELDFYSEPEADSFTFMVMCVISCIAATSEDLTNIFHADRSIVDTSLPIRRNDTLTSANTISCGLFWLSSIFHQIGVLYASNVNAIRPLLDKSLDEICPRVVSIVLRCMKAVTTSTSKEASFDLCYRTSLTTLRNIFHIIGLRRKLHIHPFHRKANTDTRIIAGSRSSNETEEEDEMFDDIDDSFFMAVDLENPVPWQTITKSQAEDIFLRIGGQEVWDFLVKCLEQSKPSMRQPAMITRNYSSDEDFQFSTLGKLVCARHAADVCALLTSICCIHQNKVDIVKIVPIPIQRTYGVIHKDKKYQSNVRQALSASLCHVAKFSTFSMNHVECALETVLDDFIAACGCADSLDTFPTCNEVLMQRIGGDANCEKEQRQLLKVQQKYAATVRKKTCFHADAEGSILRRQKGDFYDSLGAGFMSGHLWTFSEDLGILMEKKAESRSGFECQFLKKMSSILQNSNNDIVPGDLRTNCADALKALPQVSLERECLKRTMKFQSILSVCLGLMKGSRLASSVIISVSSTLLQEISETAHSVGYREVHSKSSRERAKAAKARALFSAYSNFVIPTLSWLMPQLANIQDQKMVEMSHTLFKNVFLPCLNCCDLVINDTSSSSMPLSTLEELQVVACRYLEMYAIYAGNLSTEGGENSRTNLFHLMQSLLSLDQPVIEKHVQFPFLTKRDTTRKPKNVRPNLAVSVDRYMTLIRTSNPPPFAQNASLAPTVFRRFAVQYMANRLKQSGSLILEQENALQLLLQLVTTESLAISILNQDEKDKIQLKTEICDILYGIFLCIHNSLKSQDIADRTALVIQCFQCVYHIMIMKADNKSLLEWCRSERRRDESGCILACLKVLMNLAHHLTDPQLPDFVRDYGRTDTRNTTKMLDEYNLSVADVTRWFEILQLPTANSINHQYKKRSGGMRGETMCKDTTFYFDEKANIFLHDFRRHLL